MKSLYIKPDYYVPTNKLEKIRFIKQHHPDFVESGKSTKRISAIYHSVMRKAQAGV